MTYDEFKSYLITFLWKQGDVVVATALDSLVKMADAALNRALVIQRRELVLGIAPASQPYALPTDLHTVRSLSSPTLGNCAYLTPAQFADLQAANVGNRQLPAYTVSNNDLYLLPPPTADAPMQLVLQYYTKIPDFQKTDVSWLADEFLDLYTYAVLKHSAPFLREDERVPMWVSMYEEALNSALEADVDAKYAGSPMLLTMKGVR